MRGEDLVVVVRARCTRARAAGASSPRRRSRAAASALRRRCTSRRFSCDRPT
ncbi:hypothetical protein BMASAVP1_A2411 [Burkholderia mallei SAVP1]|nr:hypothetical protein BMASAVP1_A2411 [Burkholderia mallei SAVP1]